MTEQPQEKASEYWKRELDKPFFASKDEYEAVKFRYWQAVREETGEQKNPVGFWHS